MRKLCLAIIVFSFIIMPAVQSEAIILNPNPSIFADDDGTMLWAPSDTVFSVELGDAYGSLGLFSAFGFYFKGSPAVTIPIFLPNDQAPPLQSARIDFLNGQVFDFDAGNVLQNTFINTGGFIGFVLAFDHDINPATTPLVLFTEPALNGAAGDRAFTFPVLSDPSVYLIAFDVPTAAGGFIPIANE